MSMSHAALAGRALGLVAVLSLFAFSTVAAAAMPTVKSADKTKSPGKAQPTAKSAVKAQPVINHSAPYTRLLGTAWPEGPVKFAQHQAAPAAKTPAQPVGWHHRAPYYAYYGGYGNLYGPYGYGASYGVPYYAAYGSYGFGGGYYQPWNYSYQPWIGGWSGYPYYTSFAPGFSSYYGVGYRPYVGAYGGGSPGYGGYGGYGGCCYW